MTQLRIIRPETTIDVACGWGKQIISRYSDYLIGADITGYPKEKTKSRGYDELLEYTIENHEIHPSRKNIDLITTVNLNAHLPFEAFEDIIKNVLIHCKPDVEWILVNEYDNNALSYKIFNKNQKKKDRLVTGMEHYFFTTEKEFMDKLATSFPEFEITDRKPLIAQVSSVHHYAFKHQRNPGKLMGIVLSVKDIVMSMFNSIYIKINPSTQAFLVGHTLKRKK